MQALAVPSGTLAAAGKMDNAPPTAGQYEKSRRVNASEVSFARKWKEVTPSMLFRLKQWKDRKFGKLRGTCPRRSAPKNAQPLPRLLPLHGRVHVEACDVVSLYGLKHGLPGNRGAAIR